MAETLEMARLYEEQGLTLREIGALYGISKQTISRRFSTIKIVRTVRPPAPVPKCAQIDKTELERLYTIKRFTIDKISRLFETNTDNVYGALRYYEIPKRVSINSNGKYIDRIRILAPGERIVMICTAKHPYITLYKSAKCARLRISVKKLGSEKFMVTRVD